MVSRMLGFVLYCQIDIRLQIIRFNAIIVTIRLKEPLKAAKIIKIPKKKPTSIIRDTGFPFASETILKYSHMDSRHTTPTKTAKYAPPLTIKKMRKGSAIIPVIQRFKCI